jgi:AcrR family transcriptional regulator
MHRHFPTKDALLTEAVLVQGLRRHQRCTAGANDPDPGGAVFPVLGRILDDGRRNRALKETLIAAGIDLRRVAPTIMADLTHALDVLLQRAQATGAVGADVEILDLLAVVAGALAAQTHAATRGRPQAPVAGLVLDGSERGDTAPVAARNEP